MTALLVGLLAAGATTFVARRLLVPAPRRPEALRPRPRRGSVPPVLLAASGGLVLGGPLLAATAVGAVIAGRHQRRRRAERGRVEARDAALPDALELFVTCVQAGRTPVQAVDELARRAPPPVREAFAAVTFERHRGRSLADAIERLPAQLGPAARELASAIAAAERDGLPLAPLLDRLALEARQARRRHGEAAARRLPVRLSFPLVACTLPSFVLLAIAPAVLGAVSTLSGTAP